MKSFNQLDALKRHLVCKGEEIDIKCETSHKMFKMVKKKREELSAQHPPKVLKTKHIFNYIFRNQNVK